MKTEQSGMPLTEQTQHMLTPWILAKNNGGQKTFAINKEGDEVARGEGINAEANAAFIVMAVNSYDRLNRTVKIQYEAANELGRKYDNLKKSHAELLVLARDYKGWVNDSRKLVRINEAIAKAEGQ